MSDLRLKLHQIVCHLGLCPRPRWGSLQRFPRPPSWIVGGLRWRERDEKGRGRGVRGREEREREGRGRRGIGKEGAGSAPQAKACPPELFFWRRRWAVGVTAVRSRRGSEWVTSATASSVQRRPVRLCRPLVACVGMLTRSARHSAPA